MKRTTFHDYPAMQIWKSVLRDWYEQERAVEYISGLSKEVVEESQEMIYLCLN